MDSLVCPIRHHSLKHPSSSAVITIRHKSVSYRDLDNLITGYARKLQSKGARKKNRFAILPQSDLQTIVRLWAVWRIGGVICFFNPRSPRKELKSFSRRMSCAWIFTRGESFADASRAQHLTFRLSMSRIFTPLKNIPLDSQASAVMMPTSGSTGVSKIVVHSLGNHFSSANAANQNIPVGQGDSWLLSLPLYHVSGLSILFRTFLGGGSVVINDEQSLEEVLSEYRVTHISLVGAQLFGLLKQRKKKPLRRLKYILLGGSAVPSTLIEKGRKNQWPLYLTYGLTETSSQIAATRHYDPKTRMPGVHILKNTRLKFRKDSEILIQGSSVCLGYWDGQKIRPAVDSQGWLNTGDLGKMVKEELTVFGRRDNMFISGGENIYPEEIERRLMEIEGIEQALVLPVPDKKFGQRPVAFIKTVRPVLSNTIRKKLMVSLPKFKIPEEFFAWPLIKNKGMKVHRNDFVELLQEKKIRKLD